MPKKTKSGSIAKGVSVATVLLALSTFPTPTAGQNFLDNIKSWFTPPPPPPASCPRTCKHNVNGTWELGTCLTWTKMYNLSVTCGVLESYGCDCTGCDAMAKAEQNLYIKEDHLHVMEEHNQWWESCDHRADMRRLLEQRRKGEGEFCTKNSECKLNYNNSDPALLCCASECTIPTVKWMQWAPGVSYSVPACPKTAVENATKAGNIVPINDTRVPAGVVGFCENRKKWDCFTDGDCHYYSIYSDTVNTWPGPCVYDINSADGTVQRDSDAALTAKLVTVATRADTWATKCDSLKKGVNDCKDCMAARAEQDYPDSHLQMCLSCGRTCRRCVRERKAAGAHRATVAGCFGGFTGIIRNETSGQLNDMGQVLKAADANCHDTCLDTWGSNGALRNTTETGKAASSSGNPGTNYTATDAVDAQHECYPRCIECVFSRATLGYTGASVDACYSCGKACQDCVAEEIRHHANDTNKRSMKAGIARCYADEVTGWGDADAGNRGGGENPTAVLSAENTPLTQDFAASEAPPPSSGATLSIGAIVGIAIGGAAFLALVIVALIFVRRRKQQIRGSFKTKVRNSQRLGRSYSGGSGGTGAATAAPTAITGLAGTNAQKKNGFHRFEDEAAPSGVTAVEMGPNSTREERTGSATSSFADPAGTQLGTPASSSALPAPSLAPSAAPGQQQSEPAAPSQISLNHTDTIDDATARI